MTPFEMIVTGIVFGLVLLAGWGIKALNEWRISRHNRKIALSYLEKFSNALRSWRESTPEEIARFQQQQKKRSR